MTHARLTKLSTLPNAVIDPLGARGSGPIQDGYTVLGYYLEAPKVGSSFTIARYNSNGVEVDGFMRTSVVTEVSTRDDGYVFTTANSTYQLIHL